MPSIDFTKVNTSKKQEMINNAKKYFSEHSYARVPVTEIAKAMGISRGSFYIYFDSKKECFEYVLADAIDFYFKHTCILAKEGNNIFQSLKAIFGIFSTTAEGILNYNLLKDFSFRPTAVYRKVLENRKQVNEDWKTTYDIMFESVNRHQTALSGTKFDCLLELLDECLKHALLSNEQSKDKEKIMYIFSQKLDIIKEGIYEK